MRKGKERRGMLKGEGVERLEKEGRLDEEARKWRWRQRRDRSFSGQ